MMEDIGVAYLAAVMFAGVVASIAIMVDERRGTFSRFFAILTTIACYAGMFRYLRQFFKGG